MNFALILTGGVGQRLRNSGLPKQFIELYGKPIVAYTIDKFEACNEIEKKGGVITRPAGPMKHSDTILAFVEDPDGYKIELLSK